MALMYKLPKMQRTLKDGRTHQTENGSAVSEGSSHGCPSLFHTDNRGVSRNKCNLGKIEKCR